MSYFEWAQNSARDDWTREKTFERLEGKLDDAWNSMLEKADGDHGRLREAAYDLAVERICQAIHLRGF